MRRVNDILAVAMVIGLIAWTVAYFSSGKSVPAPSANAARDSLHEIQREIMLQATLDEGRSAGYPVTIDPSWFTSRPINPLLAEGHPWVEIAHPSQQGLEHPMDIIAGSSVVASFWYNPATGVIRARVPDTGSEDETLALYNKINSTNLRALIASVNE